MLRALDSEAGLAYTIGGFLALWKPGGIIRVYDTGTLEEIKTINMPQALAIPGVAK